ncbi:MAG TPA: hypothetical protein PLO43_05840, partial [Chlamydiales bacterium]|nr:hypothetical protein [Chlamydiales bacterium]
MKRLALRPYVLLGIGLFLALSFPQKGSNYLRSGFVSISVPFFKFANWMLYSGALIGSSIQPEQMQKQLESLQLENLALHSQIERIYTWLAQEEHLEGLTETERLTTERLGAIKSNLLEQSQFLPAKVVFREPAAWSSFIWIDIGQA